MRNRYIYICQKIYIYICINIDCYFIYAYIYIYTFVYQHLPLHKPGCHTRFQRVHISLQSFSASDAMRRSEVTGLTSVNSIQSCGLNLQVLPQQEPARKSGVFFSF